MVIVDTSVWIDFLNGKETNQVNAFLRLLQNDEPIVIIPVIYQELLQGIKSETEFKSVKGILDGLPFLDLNQRDLALKAIQIYRKCRQSGITVRKSVDCIIAASSLLSGIPLLYKDRDFDQISSLYPEIVISPK